MASSDTNGCESSRNPIVLKIAEKFEQDWRAGRAPQIEDFLSFVDSSNRRPLLLELIDIEVEMCQKAGTPVRRSDFYLRFPELEEVTIASDVALEGSDVDDRVQTVDHTPSRRRSRGLHIRCPHCSNAVELLADTPYQEISCSTCGSMFSLVNRDESTKMATPLETIARFDLISRLGVGGFGTVWKARDRELDRIVAVKLPRRGQLAPHEIEQFFREARSAAQLRHPHIVPVHEVGRENETLFIVSDFIRGVTLSDWLTSNRTGATEVAEICLPIVDALHHAHEQGVIHRDLKPSNILIDQSGRPFLTDFGLAKREIGEVTMTVDGQILGTPTYMSPEQAAGEGHWTDRRTDIYSIGVMLFEMLTGELPFRGNAQMQIHQRMTQDAPDPRSLNRHIPRDMSTICQKCLEREPGRRYNSAAEVRDELDHFLRGEPIVARPLSPPARLARWAKRKPLVATTAAMIIFLAVAGPLAAFAIERQRSRLADLVVEKNNLIDRFGSERREAANQVTGLNKQLAVWEGRANPWDFWPIKQGDAPRQATIRDFAKHAQTAIADDLADGKYDELQTAQGYLALAMMAAETGQEDSAKQHYELARDKLIALKEFQPSPISVDVALAECHMQLARLESKSNREGAAAELARARELYQELADDEKKNLVFPIALMESELASATLAGFAEGRRHLERVAQIKESLSAKWPNDPAGTYELVCRLTEQEPLISSLPTQRDSVDKKKSTAGSNR